MRKKDVSGVADGLNFDGESIAEQEPVVQPVQRQTLVSKHAGGRKKMADADKKIQVSITCTRAQKERYMKVAEAESRSFPSLVEVALKEYMKAHGYTE